MHCSLLEQVQSIKESLSESALEALASFVKTKKVSFSKIRLPISLIQMSKKSHDICFFTESCITWLLWARRLCCLCSCTSMVWQLDRKDSLIFTSVLKVLLVFMPLLGMMPCHCLSAMGVQPHHLGPSPLKHGFMCQFFLNI